MEYSKLYNFEQPFSKQLQNNYNKYSKLYNFEHLFSKQLQNNYNKGTSNHLIFNIVKDTTQKQNVKKK